MSDQGPKFIIENQQIRSLEGLVAKKLSYAEMAILIALIDAKGNVVSRNTLMTLGWPGKIVVANSLNMAILSLRRMLSELEIGNVIVTVPKVGFRLEKHYLLAYVNSSLCEQEGGGNNSGNDFLSNAGREDVINNHEDTVSDVVEELIDINRSRKYHGIILMSVLSFFLFLNLFLLLQLSSHKPKLACESVMVGGQVCARDIDSEMIEAVRRYLLNFSAKKPVLIWAERNPHQGNGFKFYIVGESNYAQ